MQNPGVSAVLSFLVSGLGQLYNGEIKKGLWIIFFSVISILMIIIGAFLIGYWFFFYSREGAINYIKLRWGLFLFCLGLLFICFIGIYSIFDAYNTAKQKSSL